MDIPSGIAAHFLNRTILTAHVLCKLRWSRGVALDDLSAIYVASPEVRDKLCWVEDGAGLRLVEVKKHLAGKESATPIPNAMLSAIVYFSHSNFRFVPVNTAGRPTRSSPLLSDVLLTATGVAPTEPELAKDFKRLVSNVEHLMACAPTTAPTKSGVVVPYYWDKRIQFRHVPFVVSLFFYMEHALTNSQPNETVILSPSTPRPRSTKRRRSLGTVIYL